MSENISEELNYSPVVNNHSTVIFRKVAPQGNNSVTLSNAGAVGPTEIIIAPSVFNPAKSRLNFTLTSNSAAGANYTWLNSNGLSTLSRVVVYDSATNALLADISNFSQYTALATPSGTSFEEFSTKAVPMSANLLPRYAPTGALNGFYEDIHKCNDITNTTFNDSHGLASPTGPNAYFSRQQCQVSQSTGSNAQIVVNYSIPLSAVKHSFMSLNRNVYSPSNLVLQIYWNATDNFAWSAGSQTVPNNATITSVSASSTTISNIALQLANEGNLAIVSQVINKVMTSGVSIPIAYPTVTRQQFTSTAPSYQLQLTKGYGQRILAILTAPFSASSDINERNDHRRGTLTNFNTFLNNVALKYPSGYNCLETEDYVFGNREYLKGSAVQTVGEYIFAEWLHCDSFVGESPLYMLDQTKIDGLDVGAQSSTWSIQTTLSASTTYNWITAIIGQKVATFTNAGVMVQ